MKSIYEMNDEELAISYVNGNNKAFDLLLSRNQTKLFTYIMFVVQDRNTANDVFQDTFVKVILNLKQGKYVTNGKFSAWIMRIAHNVIMDMYRNRKIVKAIDITQDNDLSKIENKNVLDANIETKYVNEQVICDVQTMMNKLPPTQREVVFMHYYQQMSFKEIANMTNVSINTSLGRMRYAIINLRKMIKDNNMTLQIL